MVPWMQETWPHPSRDAALERAGPAPRWGMWESWSLPSLGHVGELVLPLAWAPGGVGVGDLAPPLTGAVWESWPLPSLGSLGELAPPLAGACGRGGSTPCLGPWWCGCGRSGPYDMGAGRLVLFFTWAALESWLCPFLDRWCGHGRAGGLTNSATTQTQM